MSAEPAKPAATPPPAAPLLVWIAQGFGSGRIPLAPGTFGSVLGLGWFAVLTIPKSWPILLAGTLAGLLASIWLCGVAERILNQTDPGSVVLDEIAAIPLCFLAWTFLSAPAHGPLPGPAFFFSEKNWPWSAGIFLAFRAFDILKPWPVRQSQRLPGGWGVTVDDALAAGYVNLAFLAARALTSF